MLLGSVLPPAALLEQRPIVIVDGLSTSPVTGRQCVPSLSLWAQTSPTGGWQVGGAETGYQPAAGL